MKTYKIEITIREGSDEYWEDISADGKSGCDEVLHDVKQNIIDGNWQDFDVNLIEYTDK